MRYFGAYEKEPTEQPAETWVMPEMDIYGHVPTVSVDVGMPTILSRNGIPTPAAAGAPLDWKLFAGLGLVAVAAYMVLA